MTVQEIFELCNNLMFEEKTNDDFAFSFINILNLILADNFTLNNILRKQKEKETLDAIPSVSEFTDELIYEPELLRNIIPYGCCYWLYLEDDINISERYKAKYDEQRQRMNTAVYVDFEDYYGH